jgi:hypothetical protein
MRLDVCWGTTGGALVEPLASTSGVTREVLYVGCTRISRRGHWHLLTCQRTHGTVVASKGAEVVRMLALFVTRVIIG